MSGYPQPDQPVQPARKGLRTASSPTNPPAPTVHASGIIFSCSEGWGISRAKSALTPLSTTHQNLACPGTEVDYSSPPASSFPAFPDCSRKAFMKPSRFHQNRIGISNLVVGAMVFYHAVGWRTWLDLAPEIDFLLFGVLSFHTLFPCLQLHRVEAGLQNFEGSGPVFVLLSDLTLNHQTGGRW